MTRFQERLLAVMSAEAERHGLALAGGHALRAHGCAARPGEALDFATGGETPLPEAAEGIARAFQAAGLRVTTPEETHRSGRLVAEDPSTGERCEVNLLREALQRTPVTRGGLRVVALEDAVGLAVRALYERSLAGDVADVAAVSDLYSFRELERLGRSHTEDFRLPELVMRLEFAESLAAHPDRVRRFAAAWAEDVKLRRADDGDAEYDLPDLPEVD